MQENIYQRFPLALKFLMINSTGERFQIKLRRKVFSHNVLVLILSIEINHLENKTVANNNSFNYTPLLSLVTLADGEIENVFEFIIPLRHI